MNSEKKAAMIDELYQYLLVRRGEAAAEMYLWCVTKGMKDPSAVDINVVFNDFIRYGSRGRQ